MGAAVGRLVSVDTPCSEVLLARTRVDSVPRYLKYLPIALIALAVQILAPIAACWAAATVVSDPLQSAEICHSVANSTSGQTDQGGTAHDGACAVCCVAQANASVDAPQQAALAVLYRQTARVVWTIVALHLSSSRAGSNTQARAPPLPI